MKPNEIVSAALVIAREYSQAGYRLTLRQMYYQFVARGLVQLFFGCVPERQVRECWLP